MSEAKMDAAACSACAESLGIAMETEIRYQNSQEALKKLEAHLEALQEKLVEVREEIADQNSDFRLVPLTHEDSGVVLAVCESIGADLIPLTPWEGSLFLCPEQVRQLNDAMSEFQEQNVKAQASTKL